MADALVSGASDASRKGSSPFSCTKQKQTNLKITARFVLF